MAKSNLYTGTGDNGTTSLIGGARIKKNSPRLEAYGTVDEFSSFLGIILSDALCPDDVKKQLVSIQNMLFNIGCYLAAENPAETTPDKCGLTPAHVETLEKWIDSLDEQTPKVNAFVLPGGCMLAAKTHVARTVCRRAERRILDVADEEYIDPLVIKYFNRMSDYLFILARHFNFTKGVSELLWHKE